MSRASLRHDTRIACTAIRLCFTRSKPQPLPLTSRASLKTLLFGGAEFPTELDSGVPTETELICPDRGQRSAAWLSPMRFSGSKGWGKVSLTRKISGVGILWRIAKTYRNSRFSSRDWPWLFLWRSRDFSNLAADSCDLGELRHSW